MMTRITIEADGVKITVKRNDIGDIVLAVDNNEEVFLSSTTAQAIGTALLDMGNGEDEE